MLRIRERVGRPSIMKTNGNVERVCDSLNSGSKKSQLNFPQTQFGGKNLLGQKYVRIVGLSTITTLPSHSLVSREFLIKKNIPSLVTACMQSKSSPCDFVLFPRLKCVLKTV